MPYQRTERDVTVAFFLKIEVDSAKICLKFNEDNENLMLTTAREEPKRKMSDIVLASRSSFEIVQEFVYIRLAIKQ